MKRDGPGERSVEMILFYTFECKHFFVLPSLIFCNGAACAGQYFRNELPHQNHPDYSPASAKFELRDIHAG